MFPAFYRSFKHPAEVSVLLLLVIFIPLFEVPKNILVVVYALVWIVNRYRAGWDANCGGRWRAWDTMFLVWLSSAYVLATFSGLQRNEWRGIVDLWRYIVLGWLLMRSGYGEHEWRALYATFMLSTLVATLWGLAALSVPHTYAGVELHSVGHVNHSAAYVTVSIGAVLSGLIAYWRKLSNPMRMAGLSALFVFAVAIVLGGSRAATVVSFVLVLLFAALWSRRSRAALLAMALALALFVTSIETFDKDMRRKQELAKASPNPMLNERYPLWNQALAAWRAHPWFGVGLDNFEKIDAATVRRWVEQDGGVYDAAAYGRSSHAHSLFLTTLAERGSIGLLIVLTVLASWAVSLFRGWPRAADPPLRWMLWGGAASALLATIAIGVVNTTLHHENGLLAMALLGAWLGNERLKTGDADAAWNG